MAGTITYIAPVDYGQGKIFGKKEKFTSVTRSFGNKQRGCMATTKRNLTIKPYTEGENSQHARFKAAALLCKMIREDMALKSQWVARFRADKEKTATTFNGYLLQQAMWGHISEEGAYQN